MTYYMFIESGCAFDAESEEDAREQATAWYIKQLQKGEIELLVEKEIDDDCLAAEMDSSDIEMLQEQLRKFSPPQEYDDE